MRCALVRRMIAFQPALPVSLTRTTLLHPAHHQPRLSPLRRCAMATTVPAPLPTPSQQTSHAGFNPVFAQAMLRINNPTASAAFYSALGMTLLGRLDFPDFKFSLFFYAYSDATPPDLSTPQPDRAKWLWARPEPTVELTWNWPADTFEEGLKMAEAGTTTEQYVSGNQDPKGFGYLGIAVKDVGAAVSALKDSAFQVVKEATTGVVSTAVVADPDGYHICLSGPHLSDDARPMTQLDPVFDSVMLRVKDPRSTISFFSHLGFRCLWRMDNEDDKCTDYYLAYSEKAPGKVDNVCGMRECKIKLVHVWGSENEEEQMYANGNEKPYRGFGHVGVIVDDIYKTMDGMTKEGYTTVRKPGPFGSVGELAFVAEPSTNYWVEIIKREGEAAKEPYEQPVFGQ